MKKLFTKCTTFIFCSIFIAQAAVGQSIWSTDSASIWNTVLSKNVGIGTTKPLAKLEVNDNTSATSLAITSFTGTTTGIDFYTYNIGGNFPTARMSTKDDGNYGNHIVFSNKIPGAFGNALAERMRISSSGHVGIGTNNPEEKLTISNGNLRINASNGGIIFHGGGEKIIGTAGYGIQFQTSSATPRMTILNNGNVGIGTSTPEENLTLSIPESDKQIKAMSIDVGSFRTVDNLLKSYYFRCRDIGSGGTAFYIRGDGNVGIGTANPSQRLSVNGTIQAKEIIVNTGWSDFVFDNNYKLRPLTEVEQFVKTNKHLPEIPSQKEVEKNGVQLGDISSKLLMKIEELTLYMIEMKKENEKQKAINIKLENEIKKLQNK